MRQLKSLMFIAATAMAFTGCSKDAAESPAPEIKETTITITAEQDTRTVIDENNKISWSPTGESLQVFESVNGTKPVFHYTNADPSIVDGKASFSVNFAENTTTTSFKYGAVHPKDAYIADDYADATVVKITLPQVQNPTATSYDPQGDLLIARPVELQAQAKSLNFAFGRIIAIGKMSISNLDLTEGESVKSVTITSPGRMLTGRGKANLAEGKALPTQWGYSDPYKFDNVELRYTAGTVTAHNFDVWFTCIPFDLTAGSTFSVKVVTDKGTYDRTITIADKTLAFKMSELSTFGVNMATATFTPAVVDNSIFNIPFGAWSDEKTPKTYDSSYDMEATGSSAAALTYAFTDTSKQIRANSNKFETTNYEGASSKAFWWATANSSLTISNITLGSGVNYALTFGAKTTQKTATIQAYISKDGGANFFQLAENDVTAALATAGNMLKTMNFNLNAAVSGPVSIKITVRGSENAVIDDVKLVALEAAGDNSYPIDFKIPPMLTTTPENGGTLTFAANNGTAGSAPAAKTITYTWAGEGCTFAATKATADTWYTIADNGSGTITVTPTEYTATDADRTGTVTLTVTKAGAAVKTSAITISQTKFGETTTEKTITILPTEFVSTSYPNNNKDHTVLSSDETTSVVYYTNQIMLQSDLMQWQKNASYLYNKTDLSAITSVVIDSSVNFLTLYEGTTQNPITGTTVTPTQSGTTYTYTLSGKSGYILIKSGALSKTASIVITYKN